MMAESWLPLFCWLVQYHCETNIPAHLSEYGRLGGVPQSKENKATVGCLIIENGDTLVDRLVKERIILDRVPPEFSPVDSYAAFALYVKQHQEEDGAFFYDGKNHRLAKVSRFGNNSAKMQEARERQTSLIPPDFVFYGSNKPITPADLDDHIGTKTDLAMVLPVAYSTEDCIVRAYQIKRTAYGPASLGKVTAFGSTGLQEEFFVDFEGQEMIGVHRQYRGERTGENRDEQKISLAGYRTEVAALAV